MMPNALSIAYRLGYWYMKRKGQWHWGGERPLKSLKPFFKKVKDVHLIEYTVGAKHSLDFLNIPKGDILRKLISRLLRLTHHPRPSWFRQGYLLMSVGERV
jgi:hypothetical protein